MKTTAPAKPRSRTPSRSQAASSGGVAQPGPTREDRVRQTAYALYERRGCIDGHALEDWLEAEAQVDQTLAAQPPMAH